MKNLAFGFVALAGLCGVLAFTPVGAAAQQTIRNITITAMPADATELPAAAALADNTSNPTVPGVGSFNMCWDGTNWDRCGNGDLGAGAVGSNTSRMTLASDDPAVTALQAIDNAVSGSGVNISQIGGDAPSCSDPADVSSVAISTATSGNTELVALTASQVIYVCGYNFMSAGTVDVQLIYGTGTACATGETDLTGAYALTTQTGINTGFGGAVVTKGASANALCIELSGAVQVSGLLSYVKR